MQHGDIVDFECRISGCADSVNMLVNGKNVDTLDLHLDPREINTSIGYCDNSLRENQNVAMLWIVVNSRTLQVVDFVGCKSISNNGTAHLSERAYITYSPLSPTCITVVQNCTAMPYTCPEFICISGAQTSILLPLSWLPSLMLTVIYT